VTVDDKEVINRIVVVGSPQEELKEITLTPDWDRSIEGELLKILRMDNTLKGGFSYSTNSGTGNVDKENIDWSSVLNQEKFKHVFTRFKMSLGKDWGISDRLIEFANG